MKIKTVSSLFCAVAFFGTASVAMAGAYGEPEQAEEIPRSAPVAAAEVTETNEFAPFPYLALGGLYGLEFFGGDVHQINRTYGWGVNARVGYRFVEMVAAELLYEGVVEFDADSGSSFGSVDNIDRKTHSLLANVKFFPIQGWAEPYLSIGGGWMYADAGNQNEIINASPPPGPAGPNPNTSHGSVDDGHAFAARFGLGVDLYATENLFVETEIAYVLPTGDAHNYNHMTFSLGLGYAFN